MTERTSEPVAADNALEDAIAVAVRAYELIPDGDIVTTWFVAGASQGMDAGRSTAGRCTESAC